MAILMSTAIVRRRKSCCCWVSRRSAYLAAIMSWATSLSVVSAHGPGLASRAVSSSLPMSVNSSPTMDYRQVLLGNSDFPSFG